MDTKTALLQRRSELSPAKQALLEKRRRREPVGEGTRMTVTVPRGVLTIHGDAALSFAQQRFWFLQQLEPESAVYNEPMAFKLIGALDTVALKQAIQEIVRRHEVLRGTYALVDGQVTQIVSPILHESFTIKLIDLQNVPAAEREAVLQCNMTQQAQYPFDLEREVPWRMVLLKLDEEEHVVLTVMHHIITDAWSMEVFARELATLYAAFSAKQPSPLPELPLQYTDYARWQQQQRSIDSSRTTACATAARLVGPSTANT